MRDVGLAAARFERAMIAARTKAALAVKKARGESTGTPPYGWRVGEDGKMLAADVPANTRRGGAVRMGEQGRERRSLCRRYSR
jgi:DNA invertase Pin-like site-specific DNA recombinase